jgi:hypothetical protein
MWMIVMAVNLAKRRLWWKGRRITGTRDIETSAIPVEIQVSNQESLKVFRKVDMASNFFNSLLSSLEVCEKSLLAGHVQLPKRAIVPLHQTIASSKCTSSYKIGTIVDEFIGKSPP